MSTTILLIENDEILRDDFREILEVENFNVIDAEDGLIGLQLAKDIQPHLILCDINMPNLNGYGVLQKIREDAIIKNTPFIFITSESDPQYRRKAMKIGANDYVKKNGDIAGLLRGIAKQIKK